MESALLGAARETPGLDWRRPGNANGPEDKHDVRALLGTRWHTLQGKDCKVKRKRYSRKSQRMAVERMRSSDNIGNGCC
jgi:hypothetical protein